jgi:hypothetical protein
MSGSVTVLNAGVAPDGAGDDIAARLFGFLRGLEGRYFVPERRGLDYGALARSKDFEVLRRLAAGLVRFPLDSLTERRRQAAFWLNVYNALYLHGIIERNIVATIHEVERFAGTTAYVIDRHVFSAKDVEYGILRGNRPSVSWPEPQFAADDPRLPFVVAAPDPRVHFALVCGTRSCPPIRVYSAERLDEELDLVTRVYLNDEIEVLPERKAVILPMIFYWFPMDFENGQTTAEFVGRYLDDPVAREWVEKLDTLTVLYRRWDYSLNRV